MDEVRLTKAQVARLLKADQPVVVLATNNDAGMVYFEREKYRGHRNEGKWIDRNGRDRDPKPS